MTEIETNSGGIECLRCGYSNFSSRLNCKYCSVQRGDEYVSSPFYGNINVQFGGAFGGFQSWQELADFAKECAVAAAEFERKYGDG